MDQDFLWPNLRDLPYFRAILRAVEARFYQQIQLTQPVLDLGCGDGHFATLTFSSPPQVGIDPWESPLREAKTRSFYPFLVRCNGDNIPFEDGYFASAVSNSVLEHIPDVDSVLQETARVMQKGGLFAFCVPNHHFDPNLSIGKFFDHIGAQYLGDKYRAFFDHIARHKHLDPPHIWQSRLENAGFEVEQWWHYFSPAALAALEWGHYFGAPSLFAKKLTGSWNFAPYPWNFSLTRKMVEKYYTEPTAEKDGVCTFFIARRK